MEVGKGNPELLRQMFNNFMKSTYGASWEDIFSREATEAYFDCWLSGYYVGILVNMVKDGDTI